MKILFCIPTLDHGGAERQLTYLAVELARIGHEVHVASYQAGPNLERLRATPVTWHDLKKPNPLPDTFIQLPGSGHTFAFFLRLVSLIRQLRPDIVQTILAPMDFLGGTAALLTRTPWIIKESSSGPLYSAIWKQHRDWRYKFRFAFGRMSDAVVANSAGGYEYWSSARDKSVLHLIPNPIPLDEIAGAGQVELKESNCEPVQKVVLCAGRIDLAKNVETVIDALAHLANELPFTAIICGDGSRRQHAEQLARSRGLSNRIVFTGYLDNVWDLMKRADALISLSRFDGCPNVVLEGMACGCPLVVSDIPAHREILDQSTALFVSSENPSEAAGALKEILTDVEAAGGRARAAREKALRRHIAVAARQYEQIYLNLVDGAADQAGLQADTVWRRRAHQSRW